MPFPKIRLKKSKQQYNVASKSAYVITVELLDTTTVECTLTAESTGRECMDNVCQRLCLQQADLFGLRYFSRRHTYPKIRWVELDRPLKKQLDKFAQDPYLYLGVMFYVNDVSLLEDEVTRYHYFLQLKMDVVDGRLRCNYEQAIVLASYSLQAEFGDHDPEKHTAEYIQDFPLLPKPMMAQLTEDRLSALIDAIIAQHSSLRGIAQQLAEVYYIVGAQQLDGYGQECFLAKDERGNEVLIGASLSGIVIRRGNVQSPQFFVWQDITNLVNHKRYFGIECQNFEFSVQFLLDEPEAAKYVWKMCVLQHTFYKLHSSGTESNELNITLEHHNSHQHQHQQHQVNPTPSFTDQHRHHYIHPGMLQQQPASTIQRAEIENFHAKQTQRLGPMKMAGSQFVGTGSVKMNVDQLPVGFVLRPATSNVSIHHPQAEDLSQNPSRSFSNLPFPVQGPITSARSVNDLDQLIMWPPPPQGPPPPMISSSSRQFDSRLPPYRPAPDYETAVRNKYGSAVLARLNQTQQPVNRFQQQQQQHHQQFSNGGIHTSQPTLITEVLTNIYNNNQSLSTSNNVETRFPGNEATYNIYQTNLLNAASSNAYSTSTPELNKINQTFHQPQSATQPHFQQLNSSTQMLHHGDHLQPTQDQIVAELQRLNIYKPPPPYPGRGNDRQNIYQQQQQRMMSSTSTPDLAGQFVSGGRHQITSGLDGKFYNQQYAYQQTVVSSAAVLGGSSPDLVSRRNLGLAAMPKSAEKMLMHRTLDNLHHFSTGEAVRPPMSTSPEQSHLRSAGKVSAFSAEELNNIYHLDNSSTTSPPKQPMMTLQQSPAKTHLVHDILPNNFVAYSQQVNNGSAGVAQQQQQQSQQLQLGPFSEPIYQNQAELRQQLTLEGKEPIYQNLPAHDRLMMDNDANEDDDDELNTTTYEKDITEEDSIEKRDDVRMVVEAANPQSKTEGHISRVAITNSREDLTSTRTLSPELPSPKILDSSDRKKSITKINIGAGLPVQHARSKSDIEDKVAAVQISDISNDQKSPKIFDSPTSPENVTTASTRSKTRTVVSSSNDVERVETSLSMHSLVDKKNSNSSSLTTTTTASASTSKTSSGSYHHLHHLSEDATHNYTSDASPKTPSAKPRGVRRKWGFHFGGSKTGSLKSLKSMKSASSSRENLENMESSPSSKLGPMMLATLHGLTRSRPDLLLESMTTFSAFTTPSRMPKDEIGAYLEAKLSDGEVLREFERIPKKKIASDAKTMFKTATMAENVTRNRFKDVLPYDENRVRLVGDKENKSGYINASHVSATVGDQQRFYIASQGPLPQTVANFWQMVFQCDVHIVVMLTDVADQSSESVVPLTNSNCIPYWPQKNGSTLEISDFRISKQFTSISGSGCYSTSTLHLVHMPSKRTRTIWHVHYHDWGDHGCPTNIRAYLEFLEEISSLRQHINSSSLSLSTSTLHSTSKTSKTAAQKGRNPPVLVHCSAGVGRTGVAVLCDILLYCVDHNVDIDIPKILGHLRQQRMLMVQTVAQYKFVHSVIIQYLKQSRLI